MLLTSLAILLLSHTTTLTPSDDIWIYSHASDPAGDGYLRIWGSGGGAVPMNADDAEDYSLAYIKWNLAGVAAGQKLTSAKLIVTNIGMPGFTADQSKFAPLEAHAMSSDFQEKGWTFDKMGSVLPKGGLSTSYGSGYAASTEGKNVVITIDLMKGPDDFAKDLNTALSSPNKAIAIALASPIDASTLGRAGIYKIYSKEDENKDRWPKLVLTFE